VKVFEVMTESDGETTQKPGRRVTEIEHASYYYAAETIQEVWEATKWIRDDAEQTVIAVLERYPSISIIQPAAPQD